MRSYPSPNPSPEHLIGRARYRCRTCNTVFVTPSVRDGGAHCPNCGKLPRVECGRPIWPPRVDEDGRLAGRRIHEHTVVW